MVFVFSSRQIELGFELVVKHPPVRYIFLSGEAHELKYFKVPS